MTKGQQEKDQKDAAREYRVERLLRVAVREIKQLRTHNHNMQLRLGVFDDIIGAIQGRSRHERGLMEQGANIEAEIEDFLKETEKENA